MHGEYLIIHTRLASCRVLQVSIMEEHNKRRYTIQSMESPSTHQGHLWTSISTSSSTQQSPDDPYRIAARLVMVATYCNTWLWLQNLGGSELPLATGLSSQDETSTKPINIIIFIVIITGTTAVDVCNRWTALLDPGSTLHLYTVRSDGHAKTIKFMQQW